jgi:hypothetical protein
LHVEAECLLAGELVGLQPEVLQLPQLQQLNRDGAGQLVRVVYR